MKKIRIGNDIVIKWRVTINGEEVNLEGLDLSLYISTTYQPRRAIAFTVAGNEINATYKGAEQKLTGVYRLTLYRNEGENAQSILDACDAFELVSCSCLTVDAAFGGAEVELPLADLGVGIPGLSAYEIAVAEGYEGTQEEWLASLSAASEAAAAECREVIAEFSRAEDSRVTAEAQRVVNENNRIAGEQSRAEAEANRAAAEQLRVAAESKRDTAELARIANENNRADAEGARSSAEAIRVSNEKTRVADEKTRAQNEAARVTAESKRAKSESQRETAEADRRAAEQARIANETARQTAEQDRMNAEANRVDAENARKTAEDARLANESTRQTNEQARVAAETSRESAETDRADAEAARVEAEQARAEEFAGFTTTLAAKEDKANKVTSINADADDVHYPSAKAVKDAIKSAILNSDMNASVLIAGSMPNFNTTTKTFDIGDDSFIISNGRYYDIKSLVADGSYRNINYCVTGETSSLQKFVYNTISKTLRFENANRPAVAGDIVLGCIKRVFSTGIIYYVGFTFKYAIDGINVVDNLVKDVNEIKPKIETLDSFDGRITKLEEAVNYTKVEELYQNAWVRYSNGEVVKSGGGAKLYIIKKEYIKDATKIKAFVTTEATMFAAIAFYNGEPGTSTYMQGASIQGKNDRSGAWYEASLPTEDWYCALVLDMSQYGNRKSILIDEPYEKVISNCVTSGYVKSYVDNKCGSVLNVVAYYPFYHHFSQEQSKSVIPAQSLFDIHYAKSLGFRMIEVNVHKCSDGVYVCKHGTNGTLGQGLIAKDGQDYSSTKFADVTSEWLRENISYNVYLDKYKGFIPTLDEFCRECKKLSMIVKISTADMDVLNIARKYLPDDMLWTLFNERGDYRGTIEYVYSKSNNTVDAAIAKCKTIGAPLNIVIAAGTFTGYTDEELTELVEKAHINGFTVSMVYPTTNDAIRALTFGVDAVCSTNTNANLMSMGNAKNISSLDDSDLIISEGSQYDSGNDIIRLVDAGTIKVNADKVLTYKQCGMCTVRVRYKGILTITIGKSSYATNLREYENDGNSEISFCNVLQPLTDEESFSQWITITSQGSTEIYSLDIKCSYV